MRREIFLLILSVTVICGDLTASDLDEKIFVYGRIFSQEAQSRDILIIDRQEIEQSKAGNLADLFSFLTGLDVSRRGPGDSSYDLTMRGSSFEQVLVLIDGVPFNNPQTGHFNTDFPFSVKDIERIEIIRGGSSTVYGAGAFAGVINIVLKRQGDFSLALEGGSRDFFRGGLEYGMSLKKMNLRFSAGRSNSSGYDNGREFDQLQLAFSLNQGDDKRGFDFFSGFLTKDFGANGFYAPYFSLEDSASLFSRIHYHWQSRKIRFQSGYSFNNHQDHFVLDRYRRDFFVNDTRTANHFLFFTTAWELSRWSITSGAEWKKETMNSVAMGRRNRDTCSLFVNASRSWSLDALDLGIRGDMGFPGYKHLTFFAGYRHALSSGLFLKLGSSKSFRPPSFTELYYRSPGNLGNEKLQPEISFNLESSLSWVKGRQEAGFSLFYRNQRQVIDWVRGDISQSWQAENINRVELGGCEIQLRRHWGKAVTGLAVEKLFLLREVRELESKYSLRFPDFSLKGTWLLPLTRNLSLAGQYVYKELFRTTEKGHFVNLALSYRLGRCEFHIKCDNLFNSIIEEIPGLPVSGRWFYTGLTLR